MKKMIFGIIVIIVLMGIISSGIYGFIWYNSNLKPVSEEEKSSEDDLILIKIEEGMTTSQIADLLEEKQVIKSAKAMMIYVKISNISNLKAGKYRLNNSEDTKTVLSHIVNGEIASDEIKITFIEGKNMRWIAKTIAQKTVNTEEDVFNLLEDEEYLDSLIEKYWFITDEIKDDRIYYPLEGYLLPDTYNFENEEVSVKTIFNVMLNYMKDYLDKQKEDLEKNSLTTHQILTMASITELEGKSLEDRQAIVGVFYNRLKKGMSLGSDVTAYYAFKKEMAESDLSSKQLNTENPYNTRGPNMGGKIPVGPICNPSKSAIEATLNYKENDDYYFVADKNGKVYFTKTYEEHEKKITELKRSDLWFTYQ